MLLRKTLLLLAAAIGFAPPAIAQPAVVDRPPLRELSDSEMARYVEALRALTALGADAEQRIGTDPSQAAQMSAAVGYTDDMQRAVESHGFTPESFAGVHWNAMLAYTAMEMEQHSEAIKRAEAEQAAALERMRAQMSPEQYAAFSQSMAGLGIQGLESLNEMYRDVPPANVILVRKYKPELDDILERSPGR